MLAYVPQSDADKAASDGYWGSIGIYMQAKYEADKSLVQRKSFKWTILRPVSLSDEPGTKKGLVGKVHITDSVSVSAHSCRSHHWKLIRDAERRCCLHLVPFGGQAGCCRPCHRSERRK